MRRFSVFGSRICFNPRSHRGWKSDVAAELPQQALGRRFIDKADELSFKPDFAALIYPAYLVDAKGELKPEYKVTKDSPPMFFAHANDDPVTPLSSAMLYTALKKNSVPAELHIFATGGHGYGMKKSTNPVSAWPDRCGDWLKHRGYLAE